MVYFIYETYSLSGAEDLVQGPGPDPDQGAALTRGLDLDPVNASLPLAAHASQDLGALDAPPHAVHEGRDHVRDLALDLHPDLSHAHDPDPKAVLRHHKGTMLTIINAF